MGDAYVRWLERRANDAERRGQKLENAILEIRELNLTNEDENGHRWANSDLIEQTIVVALSPE